MKVLLINPPKEKEIISNNPTIIDEERGYNPPLGLLYVAGYLEKYSKHKIKIIDAQVERLDYPGLREQINQFQPDVVGLTVMTMTLLDAIMTVAVVKQAWSTAKVILGGPHVHLYPNESISLPNIDFLVLGEGERPFYSLLENINNSDEWEKIPGLVFKKQGRIINTGFPPLIVNLDELPFPARHLVPYKKYNSLLLKGNCVTTLFTSRGCPFQCSFCDRPHLGKKFRARSAMNVVDEMEQCVRLGINDFLIYDDTFTVDKQRVLDICCEIIKRGLKINWDIRARVDTISEEMLQMLHRAGCCGIHYGVEAGTEKILKVLNKGITLDQVKRAFDLTRKHKISVLAYFMCGSPSETREDILTTFKIMRQLKPDFVHVTILTPFPGTKIYLNGLASGIIKKDYWREFAKNPSEDFVSPNWEENFNRNELNQLLVQGYKQFYMRPTYIFRRLWQLKSWEEFKKKAKAGLKVFLMKNNFVKPEISEVKQKLFWEKDRERRSPAHPSVCAFVTPKIDFIHKFILDNNSGKPFSLLDVGAGNGYFSHYFEQLYDTVALDFSFQMLKANPCKNKVLGSANELPFPDGSFDIVFCSNLLHHLSDPTRAIAEMKRVSRRYMILSEPNRNNPLMYLFGLLNGVEKGSLKFSLRYMCQLAKAVNFKILAATSLGAILPNKTPRWLLPWLKKIDGQSTIAFYNIIIAEK